MGEIPLLPPAEWSCNGGPPWRGTSRSQAGLARHRAQHGWHHCGCFALWRQGSGPASGALVLLGLSRYGASEFTPSSQLHTHERSTPVTFKLPELPYAYDALDALHVGRDAAVPPRQAPPGLRRQRQQGDRRHALREPEPGGDLQEGVRRQERADHQQRRPALQPHPLLAVDEEGRRRQEAAGQAAGHGRQGPRRLRQDARRFRAGRPDPVRLGLGVDRGQGRQARRSPRRRTARTR